MKHENSGKPVIQVSLVPAPSIPGAKKKVRASTNPCITLGKSAPPIDSSVFILWHVGEFTLIFITRFTFISHRPGFADKLVPVLY